MDAVGVSPLSDAQADDIADRIAQSSKNIFVEIEAVLGRKLTAEERDVAYKHVERVGQVFKCIECNGWRAESERDGQGSDTCCECATEQD